MLLIEHRAEHGGCGAQVFAECADPREGGRCGDSNCPHLDPDAYFDANTNCKCCAEEHHHGQAANACERGHGPCPDPDDCHLWKSIQPHYENSSERDLSAGPCPGGHCGLRVDGCTVCRVLKVTLLPGSAVVRPVRAA